MVAIIFAHPWHGSFNKAILDAITKKLDAEKKEYTVIDLDKDGFNPVLTEAELAVYSKGQHLDPLVGNYQEILKGADEAIIIYPIWWSGMPAILKGFFDKVLLVNFSHNYENGWTPLLDIKKTLVVTTSQSPTENFVPAVENVVIQNSLLAVGFKNPTWLNCDNASLGGKEIHDSFIKKVVAAV